MSSFYCVKMRSSRAGEHISGAEKIVPAEALPRTMGILAERALSHSKGVPDFINIKVESPASLIHLPSLNVTTNVTHSAQEGIALAAELLRDAGITRIAEIMALFEESYSMRGAMLVDADTLERLEPDRNRGVRATYMDDAESLQKGTASGKNHYAEAIVLATKVQYAPGIVGEICVSDDPNYVTGYVATRAIGYQRITVIKEHGSPCGGRIFLYRGAREDVAKTIEFLEKQPVIVDNVPILPAITHEKRMDGIADELAKIRANGLERKCHQMEELPTGPLTVRDGKRLLVMSSNDYLDLARHPDVMHAAADAAMKWGAGSGGARLTTGTQPPHVALEAHLARFKSTEAALVWATGYMGNVGIISALVCKGDAIISDELNHASIIDGCRLSGADVFIYRHNDMADLQRKLACCREHRRRLVISDAVFSMDGDLLNLPEFLRICREHDAFSMIDEAHSTGVLGATGRGLCEHFGCEKPDLLMGTLSKALGAEGGFLCASKLLIDYMRNRSRSFIFSTAPSAAGMAAADAALTLLERDPSRVAQLQENIRFFLAELKKRGIDASSQSAIVPIMIGDEVRAMAIADALLKRGILIPAIRYPTVAHGAARLRATVMSAHTHEQLTAVADAIHDVLEATNHE